MKVVTITGGTGGYNLLNGLKKLDIDITAIMSVFDSGGSSGKLREEFGIFSLGDLRRGFLALGSDFGNYSCVRKMAEKRIGKHCLGNLMLYSLGVPESPENLMQAERLFGLKPNHHILPASFDSSHLCAELECGKMVIGEMQIDNLDSNSRIRRIFLNPSPSPNPKCISEIDSADIIIFGPGDLYTSIIPNILIKEIRDAVKNSNAKKIFICNTMTKKGETEDFKVSDFVNEIEKYTGLSVDYVIVNNKTDMKKTGAHERHLDFVENNMGGKRVIPNDVVDESNPDFHDSEKLGKMLERLFLFSHYQSA